MNKTANFQLTQWEKTDRIMMEEFNDNWDKIDTALKGNADKAAALQTALAGGGKRLHRDPKLHRQRQIRSEQPQ